MNKQTRTRSLDVLALLGFRTKEERNAMTNEDWNKFQSEYQKKYGISFQEDLEAADDEEPAVTEGAAEGESAGAISTGMQATILAALNEVESVSGGPGHANAAGHTGRSDPGFPGRDNLGYASDPQHFLRQ